jgi:plasmid maintenance system antidote protein VapI
MARRIEAWLGLDRGGRAEVWLGLQMDYDLWRAEQRPAPLVERAPDLMVA